VPIPAFAAVTATTPVSASAPTGAAVVPVSVSAVTGAAAVLVSGVAPGASQLQALLYATFSPDVPTVLLSRRSLVTDADGHFAATIPVAPAYFSGAVITVIVQTSAGVIVGRGSITLGG
jgi:hypothetical protein